MTANKLTDAKKLKIEELLESESMMVHVRADQELCKLPSHLKPLRTVSIKLSHYFSRPLFIDQEKINIELSFDNVFFPCEIPLSCIWAVTSFEGYHTFWSEDLPDDLIKIMEEVRKDSKPEPPKEVAANKVSKLAPVKSRESNSHATNSSKKKDLPKAKGGHLSLVKK